MLPFSYLYKNVNSKSEPFECLKMFLQHFFSGKIFSAFDLLHDFVAKKCCIFVHVQFRFDNVSFFFSFFSRFRSFEHG